jgi:rfaE bifunctional protein kinase chain/domain
MDRNGLKDLLEQIRNVHVGVIGDFCLDAYFALDASTSEISAETGLPTRPVRRQRYSLGGAANVVNNLWAMGVKKISAFGVIGPDPFGKEMTDILRDMGINTDGLLVQEKEWDTHVYTKPIEKNQEQNRIDFGNFNHLEADTAELLIQKLEAALPKLDLVIINQQVPSGIHTHGFRKDLKELIACHTDKIFITDSRHHTNDYDGTIRKINIQEAMKLCGNEGETPDWLNSAEAEAIARKLYERWGTMLFLTRGEYGCTVYDENGFQEIPGLLIGAPTDPVGAGDSMLAGIGAALAAGARPLDAAELGGFVAGVTVQKLFITGTASPAEILSIGSDPDYRYRPELARRHYRAVYHPHTDIEVVTSLPREQKPTHFIFDQDGTLSILRQGWEQIMEPMMVKAILGEKEQTVDEVLYDQVLRSVQEYIDKTTGVQTLVQMKGLVDLVRQFGCVPEENIKDEFGYKEVYNQELLIMVHTRVQRLKKKELDIEDFTIKKAIPFLNALHQNGVKLYLASGTDQEDVVKEAEILGYRDLFGGRIYGSVGDITKDAKRIVLERIMTDIGDESRHEIVTVGDGPVEIRETHKRGGYTVGVASNEIRRHGLNLAKRKRLIEAGADLIIPDFSQMEQLLSLLFKA